MSVRKRDAHFLLSVSLFISQCYFEGSKRKAASKLLANLLRSLAQSFSTGGRSSEPTSPETPSMSAVRVSKVRRRQIIRMLKAEAVVMRDLQQQASIPT